MEFNMKIEEMQLDLQAVTTSLDMRTKSLCKEMADTKKDLHEGLNIRMHGTQVKIQTMRTLAEATQCGLQTRQA
jgi:hypothetical protein